MPSYTSLVGPLPSGAAAGGAGVATANATSSIIIKGRVLSVYLEYLDSPPAGTTDVTVATAGVSALPAATILAITNSATDTVYYPRVAVHDTTGTGVTYDGTNEIYEPQYIHDKVTVTIAQANNGDSVNAYLVIEG